MHTLIGHVVILHQLQYMYVNILNIKTVLMGPDVKLGDKGFLRDFLRDFVCIRPPGLPLAAFFFTKKVKRGGS